MTGDPITPPPASDNGADATRQPRVPKPPKCPECRATDGAIRWWPQRVEMGILLPFTCDHCGLILGVQLIPAAQRVQPAAPSIILRG